ncbi:c-type cytochrome biogenesis protein CcmI [Aurantimonas marina]|uniref:c-type cytochrome biogenesis protein CcmI n=1 Tax=Aurantimonas marina TaxID=2780508 RepID=UPI0019D05565|nr:c-type cytochrome biogenesis protein CcmI [Aurantimonas marina]
MAFWFIAAGMTVAATLVALWPLFRASPDEAATRADHDVEVYAAQLRELDADVERGTIAAGEAETARAEIGRRLLKAAGRVKGGGDGGAAGWRRPGVIAAIGFIAIAVPLGSAALYMTFGVPGLPDMPLATRQTPPQLPGQDVESLVATAEAQLRSNPNDGRGWDVLAPIYLRLDRPDDAATAFGNAIRLIEPTASRLSGLGEALTRAADGEVTDDAKAAFEQALTINGDYLPAHFFLALDLSQEGDYAQAEAAWAKLIDISPKDAPWMQIADAALADARQKTGAAPPPASLAQNAQPKANGPSEADMAAASEMSADDRQAMIQGMVSQLAARLEANPDDLAGWKRLIRSYAVMGDSEKASAALATASGAFTRGSAAGQEIAALGEALGLTPAQTTLSAPPQPSEADVAAASAMSADDRQAMIQGMVSQLASRLESNPRDVEGWKRLIRSYKVLGQSEKASDALRTAFQHFGADTAAGREIAALGEELGLTDAEATQTQ